MSRLTTGISGAIALVLISGAAQFALGRDLGMSPVDQLSSGSPAADASAVNRGAKTDRATGPAGSPAVTRTVSLKLSGFSDTTFLLRVPVTSATPTAVSATAKRVAPKPAVACEPMVSVLTEVAKQLEPGRCVT
ncbi:hypothetical protein [Bradyrhizobium sp.]|jgi:hypothetical protein|uniref:hypothetical protein n=1 Tax=Bradyrhizobium sp. TaxID=376 RepID=UPI003C25569B